MEGWKENEIRNKNLMAPCGLYCGACGVYIATRDNNQKFKTIMGNLYGTKPEETECLGACSPTHPNVSMATAVSAASAIVFGPRVSIPVTSVRIGPATR